MGHWGCKMLPPYLYIIDLRIQTPPQKKCDGSKSISPKYKIDPIPFLGHTCILNGEVMSPWLGQAALCQDSPNSCPPYRWCPKAPWWETKMEALDVLVLPGFKWPFWGFYSWPSQGLRWPPFGEIKRSRMEEALEMFLLLKMSAASTRVQTLNGTIVYLLPKFD